MHKFIRRAGGITLIEVMLVLAIGALVLVMSVRYYQTSQNATYANALMLQVQQYINAGNSIYQNTGSYPSKATMEAMLPAGANAWRLPWGGTGTYAPFTSGSSSGFTFTFGVIPGTKLCTMIRARFQNNSKLILGGDLTGTGICDMVIYYGSSL